MIPRRGAASLTEIRHWAHRWLCQERRHKRWRPKPTTPTIRRDSLRRLARDAASVAKRTAALREQLHTLPDGARDLLATTTDNAPSLDATSPFAGLSPEARRWAEGLDALRVLECHLVMAAGRLAALAAAAERAADLAHQAVRRGAPERGLGAAIKDLGWIWLDATGHAPTQSWDDYGNKRSGPFRAFVYAAIAPLWSEAESVDGLIDGVCIEFRSRSGK